MNVRTIRISVLVAAALVAVAAIVVAVSLGAFRPGSAERPADVADAAPAADTSTTGARSAECGDPTVTVSTAKELKKALKAAKPGTSIRLEPGTYSGRFVITAQGTAKQPVELCGPRDAVLDGGGTSKGYALHLDGAAYVTVSGFSVQNGQKGVMADATTHSTIRDLSVSGIGDEAIHLRNFSTDNTVEGNTIRDTGLRKPKFGEGIYIGTAESNWGDITGGKPDASDRNTVIGNDIAGTTSESVDLKEGTSGGVLRDNTFDGADITAADSWVDVKGNDWLIEGNTGENSPLDGFQTHEILDGWGTDNVFRDNTADVNGEGFGYSITPELDNVVECNNEASGAAEGLTNVDCND
jgi:hypothetical protein